MTSTGGSDGGDGRDNPNPEEPLEELVFVKEYAERDLQKAALSQQQSSSMSGSGFHSATNAANSVTPQSGLGNNSNEDADELASSLLQRGGANLNNGDDGDAPGMTASQFITAAGREHSSVRLVLRKIGNFVATFTLLAMLVIIPIVTYKQLVHRKLDFAAFQSAGVMVLGTLILSIRLVYLHFTHWYMPNVQKYVIRILWMVPLYAVQSWLSLRFRGARIYIDTIRDLYEAYVISSFFYYLIELLGGQEALVRTLRMKAAQSPNQAGRAAHHTFPLNFVLQPWKLGMEFMVQTKHGVLQYVVVKAVATIFIFGFQSIDVYNEGDFRWDAAYPYMAFVINISVMYSLYCLVLLFHVVSHDLRYPINWHPLGKFLCVKGVVFFTWWQGVVIFYLQSHGVIDNIGKWTGEEVANGLIDYCVCIEMVFFAIAHSYTFTYTEYLPSTVREAMENAEREQQNTMNNLMGTENLGGVTESERSASYRPPTVLSQPLNFRDAFWSSTLPSETIQDIRRLRHGVERVISQATDSGTISLQHMDEDAEYDTDAETDSFNNLSSRLVDGNGNGDATA